MFTSLQLADFRGFRSLSLDGLRRVNLVVGRNNSGKTSLLEGIAVLCDQFGGGVQVAELRKSEKGVRAGSNVFHKWLITADGSTRSGVSGVWDAIARDAAIVRHPNHAEQVVAEATLSKQRRLPGDEPVAPIPTCVASTVPKGPERLVETFANAVLHRDGEELIERLLREVDPRIRKVRIDPTKHGNRIVVDIGLPTRVPLSQLGQGVGRLIDVFSEIIGSDARVCLIDEIENGVHHSSLTDVWTGIATSSEAFDVQVFATTHSHECIEAAHTAFCNANAYDLSVVQLFRETTGLQGRVLDRKHIQAGIDGQIDLRG